MADSREEFSAELVDTCLRAAWPAQAHFQWQRLAIAAVLRASGYAELVAALEEIAGRWQVANTDELGQIAIAALAQKE